MHDETDDDMVQQMLDWLSRGMDLEGNFHEVHSPGEIVFTDEDEYFLRQLKITASTVPDLGSFAE